MSDLHILDMFQGRLKLRHLVVALVIDRTGSAVAAARELFVSQPAISRVVYDLEVMLGARLFERTPRGMKTTPTGAAFLQHAKAAISHINQGAAHVQDLVDGQSGSVTVGVHLAGANRLLPQAIISLKRERPGITVRVVEDSPQRLREELANGTVDLAISRLSMSWDNKTVNGEALTYETLYRESMTAICAKDHWAASRDQLSLADLSGESWVLPAQGTALRQELLEAFARTGIEAPAAPIECSQAIAMQTLVLDGKMIGIAPESLARANPELSVLKADGLDLDTEIGAMWADDHLPTPAAGALHRHLRSVARTFSAN